MSISPTLALRAGVVALAAVASSLAFAQGGAATSKMTCSNFGANPLEPLAEGRALQVVSLSCRVESGPLAEGVLSGSQIYEFQGANGTFLSGDGVIRSPRGMLVYRNSEGTIALKMADGKVVGATSAGKGVYKGAYGAAASLAGKSYSYRSTTTGMNQFVIEVTDD